MTERFDAAVVGAGPAGSSAARELARAGFAVAVFEKDAFPRHKACGELLSPGAIAELERCGLRDRLRAEGAEEIRTGAICLPGDTRAREFTLPAPALGVSRHLLDRLLSEEAARAGARVVFRARVEEIGGDPGSGFELRVRRPAGAETTVRARAVLAAWGRWSPLEGRLGRDPAARRSGRYFGWKRHYRGDSRAFAGRVHLYFFRGGYCGLSRVERGVVNFAGIASEREIRRVGGGWEELTRRAIGENRLLGRDLAGLAPAGELLGSTAVEPDARRASRRGILAAGDAAGVRDPFTGDGQASALVSGRLAGEALAEFLGGRCSGADLEARYGRAWRECFGRAFFWDRVFRRLALSGALRSAARPLAGPLARRAFRLTRLSAPSDRT
jgi:flavin-dependent dehydrogenase